MAALAVGPWGGQAAPLGAASSVGSALTPSARASRDGAPPHLADRGQSGHCCGGHQCIQETDPCRRISKQLGHWADECN